MEVYIFNVSLFWTGAGPSAAFVTNYIHGGEGREAIWQITKHCACMRWPLLSVILIAWQRGSMVEGVQAAIPTGAIPTMHATPFMVRLCLETDF